MKIGINMLLWSGDVTAARYDAIFERLAQLGYDGVEVPVFALDPGIYLSLGERLREFGLESIALTVRGPHANPIDSDPKIRSTGLRESLLAVECAAALGSEILCGPILASPGIFAGAPSSPQHREWALELLRALGEAADVHQLTLAVESLNRFQHFLATTAAETADLCREAGSTRCRMLYDTFHAHIEEKDVSVAIHDCADMLAYVHISENDRTTPGLGQVQWDATFAALHDIEYDGWLTLEAFGQGDPTLDTQLRVWRRAYGSEDDVASDAISFIKSRWEPQY